MVNKKKVWKRNAMKETRLEKGISGKALQSLRGKNGNGIKMEKMEKERNNRGKDGKEWNNRRKDGNEWNNRGKDGK